MIGTLKSHHLSLDMYLVTIRDAVYIVVAVHIVVGIYISVLPVRVLVDYRIAHPF